MKHIVFIAAALTLLSACTPPLTQSEMAKFGKSADNAVSVLAAPSQIQTRLSGSTSAKEAQCQYLRGGRFGAAATSSKLKPSPLALEQARVGKALGAYSKGIIDAADGKGFEELEAAARDLIGATSSVAVATGGSNTAEPIANALVSVGLRIGQAQRDRRIREIMERVYPDLIQLERLVARDAAQVESENRALFQRWDSATNCVLAQVRKDPGVALPLYDAALNERADIERQITLGRRAPQAITALKEAHLLVAAEPPQMNAAIALLDGVYKDLEPIISQLEN